MSQDRFVESELGAIYVGPRYRNFVVTNADATVLMFSGIDVTPEEVIRKQEEIYRRHWAAEGGDRGKTSPLEFRLGWGDKAIWSDNQLVAVCVPLTPSPGVCMMTFRFDKSNQGFSRGRLWAGDDHERPGDDDDDDDDVSDVEMAIIKVMRGAGLNVASTCEYLGRMVREGRTD